MGSLNIFNIVTNLKKLIEENYVCAESEMNQLEIELSEGIFSFIEKFIENLENEDSNEELSDFSEGNVSVFEPSSEDFDSESEDIPTKRKVIKLFILIFFNSMLIL